MAADRNCPGVTRKCSSKHTSAICLYCVWLGCVWLCWSVSPCWQSKCVPSIAMCQRVWGYCKVVLGSWIHWHFAKGDCQCRSRVAAFWRVHSTSWWSLWSEATMAGLWVFWSSEQWEVACYSFAALGQAFHAWSWVKGQVRWRPSGHVVCWCSRGSSIGWPEVFRAGFLLASQTCSSGINRFHKGASSLWCLCKGVQWDLS